MPFEPADDSEFLLYELGGKHRAQVLSTIAAIGLPDRLRALQQATVPALAAALGCDAGDLESLMRAAAGLGCLHEAPPGTFALTARGEQLCSDALGPFAAFLGSKTQWDPWSRFRDAMQGDGRRPAFELTFGRSLYDHLANDPAASRAYDAAIDVFTQQEAQHLRDRLDLADRRCLIDIGGGRGTLLRELLPGAPGARGILFDLPQVIAAVAATLPARVEAVAGDFFGELPVGDVYLIKRVLHNWNDEAAVRLLRNCAETMHEGGIVVVIDAVLAPDNRPDLARMLDLEMRVLTGGRERRKPELRRLLQDAGLVVERVEELTAASWLFVGRR